MSSYIEVLLSVLFKPVQFFENVPGSSWQDEPLSFAMVTGWIISAALTVVIFINNYLPTGLSLIEGIYGTKLIIAVPVLAVMGMVFFLMTLLIIGGITIVALLCAFIAGALLLNFLMVLLGGKGNFYEMIKATLYTSAVVLIGLINIAALVLVKYHIISFPLWMGLEKIIFNAVSVYFLWLISIVGWKTHRIARWKSLLAAVIPFLLLVLINIVFSAKILPKFIGFLG